MISTQWTEKRKPYWQRLEHLVTRAHGGIGSLSHGELQELGLLYRQSASDLSTVLEDPSSRQLAAYLNQLLARSHNLVYAGRGAEAKGLLNFYREEYPRIFRGTFALTALCTALFFVSAIACWAVTMHDPGFASRFLGPEMMDTIARREMWTHSVVAMKPVASAGIMTNNLTVSFMAFAMGITVVGTIWAMVMNGMMLGVIGAATWKAGMALKLWSFVAAHGALELPAIFIAGGAGLEIARGLLFPGLLPRKASLTYAGGRASKLILGTIPMLIVAGVIEAFFSPTEAPVFMKFTLSAVLFTALVIYLSTAGRKTTASSGL